MNNKKLEPKAAEKLMRAAEKNFGRETVDKVRGLDAKEIDRMLRQLSEDDLSRLEAAIRNPNSLAKMMTPENTARIKKILEG